MGLRDELGRLGAGDLDGDVDGDAPGSPLDFGDTLGGRMGGDLKGGSPGRVRRHERDGEREQPATPGWCQWFVVANGAFVPGGRSTPRLPAGGYSCSVDDGMPRLIPKTLVTDDMIFLPDSTAARILGEIDRFWTRGDVFARYGFLHKRGYLCYGPPGMGKSIMVAKLVQDAAAKDWLAVFCQHPGEFLVCMAALRRVEPERPLLAIFEDIDATINNYGDSDLLQWLDGNDQCDRCVSIATTNYPERLDPRLVNRPRRFDELVKIGPPDRNIRRAYFLRKMPEIGTAELDQWVRLSRGMSYGALADMIVCVRCLDYGLEQAAERLRQHLTRRPDGQRDFKGAQKVGFNGNGHAGGLPREDYEEYEDDDPRPR